MHLETLDETLSSWPLFHKTSKTSLHRVTGIRKDVFMFYETEPWGQDPVNETLNWAETFLE